MLSTAKMQLATVIAILIIMTPMDVCGRLGLAGTRRRRLQMGMGKGPNSDDVEAAGDQPDLALKDDVEELSRGGKSSKSRGRSAGTPVRGGMSQSSKPGSGLNFDPVDVKEPKEATNNPDFEAVLQSYKAYLKHANDKIRCEKDEHDAANEEVQAENAEVEAQSEESAAVDEAGKAVAQKKLVEARMAKQAAKERCERAREQTRALEATSESVLLTFAENQEKYRVSLQAKALKSAQSTEDEVKKEKEQGNVQDKTVLRGKKEAAIEAARKDKDEVENEANAYKDICKQVKEAQEKIAAARMVKLKRTEARLARLGSMPLSDADREAAMQEFGAMSDEDKVWAELSEAKSAESMKECKAVINAQKFLFDRVLAVHENIEKRELAKLENRDATEKYLQELDEKMAADKEVADACKEEADALSDEEREAAHQRLATLREQAKSKDILLKAAADKLRDAQTRRLEVDKYMIEEATEKKQDEKKGMQTPVESEAVVIMDRVLLSQADDGLEEDQKGAQAMETGLQQAILILNEKLDGETAVLMKYEEEEAIAAKAVEDFGANETSSQAPVVDDVLSVKRQALQELLEKRQAEVMEAKIATTETQAQQRRLMTDEEIVAQAKETIPRAEAFYKDLVTISAMQEEQTQVQATTEEGGV